MVDDIFRDLNMVDDYFRGAHAMNFIYWKLNAMTKKI